jgi:transcriptional regulator with XRE-family HTH domain
MKWNGAKIKELLDEKDLTVSGLADSISVTRQTVHNWLKGSLPKGQDLLKLCEFFKVNVDAFFIKQELPITLIAHRTHRRTAITPAKVESARILASEYLIFFKNVRPFGMVPSLLDKSSDKVYLRELANSIRKMSGIETNKTMTYKAVFKLLDKLGVFTIFREFSSDLGSYAFFCLIENNRVVFIDSNTHVIDLIFSVLHETIHAIRTEKAADGPSDEEEVFCDKVACFAQFPESYINKINGEIQGVGPQKVIQILKSYALKNGHSMHGIKRAIEAYTGKSFPDAVNIYPVESELKKESPTIGEILFEKNEPRIFWERLKQFSPHFTNEIKNQLDSISIRKLAQFLGLPTGQDAQCVIEELSKSKKE